MTAKTPATGHKPVTTLSGSEARDLALRAQGFGDQLFEHPIQTLDRLGVIQLDSVNALARTHDLVPFSRIGVTPPADMHRAIYQDKRGFEYWGHAASWLPIADYRFFLPRMAHLRERWREAGANHAHLYPVILDRIRAEGPLSAAAFEDTRERRGTWWDWKPAKLVLEHLFAQGDLMSAGRVAGFDRLYDLPERVLPAHLDTSDPGPEQAARHLMLRAVAALGVATGRDAADYFRLSTSVWSTGNWRQALADLLADGHLVEVAVDGWPTTAVALPAVLEQPWSVPPHRPTFLSPFDNLIWERSRTERMFDFNYRIEIYVPAPRRKYGYYVLPLLANGMLVGRADLKLDRAASILRVRGLWLEGATAEDAASAIRDLALHLGAGALAIERVEPPTQRDLIEKLAT